MRTNKYFDWFELAMVALMLLVGLVMFVAGSGLNPLTLPAGGIMGVYLQKGYWRLVLVALVVAVSLSLLAALFGLEVYFMGMLFGGLLAPALFQLISSPKKTSVWKD